MMSHHLQALSPVEHQGLRLKDNPLFEQTKQLQFIPLYANEFIQASTCYPIFFIKDSTSGKLFSIALFGLEKGENLFYDDEQWRATYASENMRCWPFSIAKTADNQWTAHIDRSCQLLSNTEGHLLYDRDEPSDALKKVLSRLDNVQQQKVQSMAFTEWLLDFQLLKPVRLSMEYMCGEKSAVNGLYSIDENVLQQLDKDALSTCHQCGYLASIYALLASQHNLYDLIRLKKTFAARPVRSLQLLETKTDNFY